VILSALLIPAIGVGTGPQSPLPQALAQDADMYEDSGSDFPRLIGRLSARYSFPLGMEIDGELLGKPASVKLSRGTVADALSAIVNQMPGYQWVSADGVVNVRPRESTDSVLEVEIAHFRLRRVTPDKIAQVIALIPEINAWLQQNGVEEHTPARVYLPEQRKQLPRLSVDLRRRTLRQVLNAMVAKPPLSCWSVTRYVDGGKYLGIVVE